MTVKVKRKKTTKAAVPSSIVIRTEQVDIKILNKYHKNPRKGDVEKVAESLKENGQFKPIVVNVGTITGRPNEILAGNHTFMGAQRLKWKTILVSWVDVDEDGARRIVLADNGASDGSTYDDSILTELLAEQKESAGTLLGTTYGDDVLSRLIKDVKDEDPNKDVDKIEDASDEMDGVADLANGIVFPSDAPYEIPELRLDMIPDGPILPLETWGGHEVDGQDIREDFDDIWWLSVWHTGCRGINWRKSIACFYTDDFHFDPVFNDPAKNTKKILNLGMPYAIMPNYTIHKGMPVASWIWASYRSYYIGRYFQEAGIQVIPDIQTGDTDEVLDVSLAGIPHGAGLVAAQAQMARGDKKFIRQYARMLKEAEDRLGFKNIIIYGHTDADEIAERAGFSANVIKVESRTVKRREYLNSGSTINTQKITKGKKRKVKK